MLWLGISLGSDQLKYAVEYLGKSGKLWGKQLDLLKVCFLLDSEEEGSKISLNRLNQKL